MKRVAWALGGLAAWCAFRLRWRRRFHYHTYFGRTLCRGEMVATHLRLLDELDRVFSEAGIAWWMEFGTLLGAWRDGGYIPWDDDVDVCVLHRDHDAIRGLSLRPPYRMVEVSRAWSVDKVVPGLERVWPCRTFLRLLDTSTSLYVDIFEMDELADGRLRMLPLSLMHPTVTVAGDAFEVPRDVVFPLGRQSFEGRSFPAPRDAQRYLQAYYGPDLTPNRLLDEATGRYVRR